jgi:hypothetical protein
MIDMEIYRKLASGNILSAMKTYAFIRLKSDCLQIGFEWLDFDGDDCFNDFHINVVSETGPRRFDFGECAVNGLRKISKFFRETSQKTVSSGFRHPDVCYYDLDRTNDGYRLVVGFERTGLREEFNIEAPQMEIDDEFMRTVYSG